MIEEDKIDAIQKKKISHLVDNLGLPESASRALLLKFAWNEKMVENKFIDDFDLLKN